MLKPILNAMQVAGLLLLLGCAAATNSGGGGPESDVPGGPGQPNIAGGVGEQNFASPEMPEIALGPGFDGGVDKLPRPVEVRIPAEVSILCQSSDEKKVTKRIQGRLECRWANTNDPFQTCGRGRYLRVFDMVTHHYIDVMADEGNASFMVDFTFNLPTQTAAYYNPASDTANDSTNSTANSTQFNPIETDFSGLISEETDLKVFAGSNKPQEYGKQKYCQTKAFCIGIKFFRDLGAFLFSSSHQVAGPNSGTPFCEN